MNAEQNTSHPKNITVLAGGSSSERHISLQSGSRVTDALCRRGYNAVLADPAKDRRPCEEERTNTERKLERRGNSPEISDHVLEMCRRSDAVFLALHGGAGENGTISAILEAYSIPHTGSGVFGCAAAMDKLMTKRLLESAGVPTPLYAVYRAKRIQHGIPILSKEARQPLAAPRYPCIVKPLDGGSSLGVSEVKTPSELEKSILTASSYGGDVLIEEKISGREFSVGILDGRPLSVTEIIPRSGLYDHDSKYTPGMTEEITPAKLEPSIEKKLKRVAIRAHNALSLGYYSRVDIILDARSGIPFVLELNALPGMTELSLLPAEARAAGISFDELCERILLSAVKSN